MNNTENGRSMIEMLGVLAIIGVLSVGGIAGYSKAMHKYRMNKAIEQITLIAGNVRSFFAPHGNYTGLDNNNVLLKAKIIPDEMIEYNTDGTLKQFTNAFGAHIALRAGAQSANGDNRAFILEYHIPFDDDETCIEMLSHDCTAAGIKGIVIYSVSAFFTKVPGSLEAAVSSCSSMRNVLTSFSDEHSSNIWMYMLFDAEDNCNNINSIMYNGASGCVN